MHIHTHMHTNTHAHTHTCMHSLLDIILSQFEQYPRPACHYYSDTEQNRTLPINPSFVVKFFVTHVHYCCFYLLPSFLSFPIFITSVFLFSFVSYYFLPLLLIYFCLSFILTSNVYILSVFFITDLMFRTCAICPQSVLMFYISHQKRLLLSYITATVLLFFIRHILFFDEKIPSRRVS
jgi:hypothetical protein